MSVRHARFRPDLFRLCLKSPEIACLIEDDERISDPWWPFVLLNLLSCLLFYLHKRWKRYIYLYPVDDRVVDILTRSALRDHDNRVKVTFSSCIAYRDGAKNKRAEIARVSRKPLECAVRAVAKSGSGKEVECVQQEGSIDPSPRRCIRVSFPQQESHRQIIERRQYLWAMPAP